MSWVVIANLKGAPGDAAALDRFLDIESKNVEQDGRLNLIESKNTTQDNRLTGVEADNSGQDGRIDDLEDRATVFAVGSDYAIALADQSESVAGGVLETGQFNFEVPPLLQRAGGVLFQPITAPEWAHVFVDNAGNVALGITSDGEVIAPKFSAPGASVDPVFVANASVGLSKTLRNKVSAIGDSLTDGYFGGAGGQNSDAWPARLATLVGGSVAVTNLGSSGYTVDEESIRIGALPIPLTVTGGSIPGSGSVEVTTTAVIGWYSAAATRSFAGSLAGIHGTLARAADGSLAFTRTTAGSSTPVSAGTIFKSDYDGHDAETLVIMLGHNNASTNVKGSDASVAEHVSKGIKRIAAWHSRQVKQILVMSVTTKTTWTNGTAGYATVQEINTQLAADWGARFYNLRKYLVEKAIYDLGITPTAEDITAMAGDTLPPSIMDPGDPTHYSKATAVLVGDRVYEYLTTRDWIES